MRLAPVIKPNAMGLQEGVYVMDDVNAAESLARGELSSDFPVNTPPINPSEDYNGKNILFVRSGGYGDILFCTPTIRRIKELWPYCSINFACLDRFAPIIRHDPNIDRIITYPMPLEKFAKDYHAYVLVSEPVPDAEEKTVHSVDYVASKANVELTDKQMRYYATEEEIQSAKDRFPQKLTGWPDSKPVLRIGIQVLASALVRTWPQQNVIEFIQIAERKGVEIFLFGEPMALPAKFKQFKQVRNLMIEEPGLSFRESCAVMNTCDGFVGPDSSLIHIAGALGIPAVAVYAAFPAALRTAYAPSIVALQGNQGCSMAPCHHHIRPRSFGMPFPSKEVPALYDQDGPCVKSGVCVPMLNVPANKAWNALMNKIKGMND